MTGFDELMRDPGAAAAKAQALADKLVAKAERYEAARARTEELELSSSTKDGVVKVTVRADGNVSGIEFSDKIRSVRPEDLAAMVLDTMRRAQSGIAGQVEEVFADEVGNDDPATRALLIDQLRSKFPDEPEEQEEPEPRLKAEDDEEYNPW